MSISNLNTVASIHALSSYTSVTPPVALSTLSNSSSKSLTNPNRHSLYRNPTLRYSPVYHSTTQVSDSPQISNLNTHQFEISADLQHFSRNSSSRHGRSALLTFPNQNHSRSYRAGVDSASSGHYLPPSWLTLLADVSTNQQEHVRVANGQQMVSSHHGLLNIPELPQAARSAFIFPGLTQPLISVGLLCDHGCTVQFTARRVAILLEGTQILVGYRQSGLCVNSWHSTISFSDRPPRVRSTNPSSVGT